MRTLFKLMTAAAAAATVAAMAVAPVAMADPPGKTVPKPTDVVGVGSDTIQNVMDQFSHDYNAAHTGNKLYSWDATNPKTGAIHDNIVTKKGCSAIPRPNGSSEGIVALTTENKMTSGHACMDFSRSSRNRAPTDPAYAAGGISFIALAGDALTYATQPGSNAPKNLSTKQLFEIYTCKVTHWNQVGGKSHAKIAAFIPQSGSGTRSFFLTAIGIPTGGSPGTCVSDVPTKAVPGGTLEENEGVNPALNKNKANVIVPYSIGKYLAEFYHSAKCFNALCTKKVGGQLCPAGKGGTNLFSCDTHGTMLLNMVNHTAPTKPFPLPAKCGKTCPVVNPKFTANFTRSLFVIVPFPKKSTSQVNGIPKYLLAFFGPKGFTCTSKTAKRDLMNYGFVVFPAGSKTGHTINHCGDTH